MDDELRIGVVIAASEYELDVALPDVCVQIPRFLQWCQAGGKVQPKDCFVFATAGTIAAVDDANLKIPRENYFSIEAIATQLSRLWEKYEQTGAPREARGFVYLAGHGFAQGLLYTEQLLINPSAEFHASVLISDLLQLVTCGFRGNFFYFLDVCRKDLDASQLSFQPPLRVKYPAQSAKQDLAQTIFWSTPSGHPVGAQSRFAEALLDGLAGRGTAKLKKGDKYFVERDRLLKYLTSRLAECNQPKPSLGEGIAGPICIVELDKVPEVTVGINIEHAPRNSAWEVEFAEFAEVPKDRPPNLKFTRRLDGPSGDIKEVPPASYLISLYPRLAQDATLYYEIYEDMKVSFTYQPEVRASQYPATSNLEPPENLVIDWRVLRDLPVRHIALHASSFLPQGGPESQGAREYLYHQAAGFTQQIPVLLGALQIDYFEEGLLAAQRTDWQPSRQAATVPPPAVQKDRLMDQIEAWSDKAPRAQYAKRPLAPECALWILPILAEKFAEQEQPAEGLCRVVIAIADRSQPDAGNRRRTLHVLVNGQKGEPIHRTAGLTVVSVVVESGEAWVELSEPLTAGTYRLRISVSAANCGLSIVCFEVGLDTPLRQHQITLSAHELAELAMPAERGLVILRVRAVAFAQSRHAAGRPQPAPLDHPAELHHSFGLALHLAAVLRRQNLSGFSQLMDSARQTPALAEPLSPDLALLGRELVRQFPGSPDWLQQLVARSTAAATQTPILREALLLATPRPVAVSALEADGWTLDRGSPWVRWYKWAKNGEDSNRSGRGHGAAG